MHSDARRREDRHHYHHQLRPRLLREEGQDAQRVPEPRRHEQDMIVKSRDTLILGWPWSGFPLVLSSSVGFLFGSDSGFVKLSRRNVKRVKGYTWGLIRDSRLLSIESNSPIARTAT